MTPGLRRAVACAVTAVIGAAAAIRAAGQEPGESWLRQFDATRAAPEAPPDHTVDWIHSHALAAESGQDASCASCHSEQWCTDCHGGAPAPPSIHPPGYAALHGFDALGGTASCASCHQEQLFCRSCHVQTGWTSDPGARPPPGTSGHPPGWVERHHGDDARRDLAQCASCHSEASCVTCHQFVNPHGADFVTDCGRLLEAGAASCATCHTSTSTLPMDALLRDPRCR